MFCFKMDRRDYSCHILRSFLVSYLILWKWTSDVTAVSKYSAEVNKQPFRMHKYNLLWEKAQKTLAPSKLEMLQKDLRKLDKISIELKHLQAEGKDLDGSLEAEVRERFLEILDKYSLETSESTEKKQIHKEKHFESENINKLWEQALYDGNTN